MSDAIFLSASVPDPRRGARFAETADTVAITSAVAGLLHVILGRRRLVWGGHPAITPMIHVIAERYRIDYGRWVSLYQSRYFEDEYPEDNARFRNLVEIDPVGDDRELSLLAMRRRMLSDRRIGAAVFIGGMQGIFQELELLRELQPEAVPVPLASTGGAALLVADQIAPNDSQLRLDLNYVRLLHRRLDVSELEARYATPELQPADVSQRFERPRQV
jgi:hypothetical protein